jgi:hypothetical protein
METSPSRSTLTDPLRANPDDCSLLLEPRLVFDTAFLGHGMRCGDSIPYAIYDYDKVIDALVWWHECPREEAVDYCAFNIEAGWVGPGTPLLLRRCSIRAFEDSN